jgi:hypothetical protein
MQSTPRFLLIFSIVANVTLLGVVLSQRTSQLPPSADQVAFANASKSADSKISKTADGPSAWKTLINGDEPADWVKSLRAAGFPDSIISAVVGAQIRERYSARRSALQSKSDDQYWSKSWNNWGGGDPETRAALRALWREEREQLKRALGDSYADSPEYQRAMQRQFGNIPKEKLNALQTINEDYQELTSEIHQSASGFMLPEDREKLAFLEKEKRADLEAILTPQELQDYELRSSQTANSLRWQLTAFTPSEQEFRSIFNLQREFDLEFSNRRSTTDEAANQLRATAETAMQEQIKASLGEARYAEYQRAKDHNYQQLASLTDRLGLPKESAVTVYNLAKDIEKRSQQIRSDPKLKGDARNEALAKLAEEANATILKQLGDRGADAYKENGGGWWLRNLTPRSAKK